MTSENVKNSQTLFVFLLPNNCKWSGCHVYPPNWKTTKAKLSLNWYADCIFNDPQQADKYPKGKSIRLKKGVNRFKTLVERREVLDKLILETAELFKNGYNPITENLIKSSEPNKVVPDSDLRTG